MKNLICLLKKAVRVIDAEHEVATNGIVDEEIFKNRPTFRDVFKLSLENLAVLLNAFIGYEI